MRQIKIEKENAWGISEEKNKGFSLSYSDEEKEAVIFDLSADEVSKLIPKGPVAQLWEEINQINFQKVMLENENHIGFDGSNSILELSVGLHSLRLSLWCPSLELYREKNMDESFKLLMIINAIVKFAADNNVATDFEF